MLGIQIPSRHIVIISWTIFDNMFIWTGLLFCKQSLAYPLKTLANATNAVSSWSSIEILFGSRFMDSVLPFKTSIWSWVRGSPGTASSLAFFMASLNLAASLRSANSSGLKTFARCSGKCFFGTGIIFETKTMRGPSGEQFVKFSFNARVSSGKFSNRFVLKRNFKKLKKLYYQLQDICMAPCVCR